MFEIKQINKKNNNIEVMHSIYKKDWSNSHKLKNEIVEEIYKGIFIVISNNEVVGVRINGEFYSSKQLLDEYYYSRFLQMLDSNDIPFLNCNDGFKKCKNFRVNNIKIYDCLLYHNKIHQIEFKFKNYLLQMSDYKNYIPIDYTELKEFEYFLNYADFKFIFRYNDFYYILTSTILKNYIKALKKGLKQDFNKLYAIRVPFELLTIFESKSSLNKKLRVNKSLINNMVEQHKILVNDLQNGIKTNYKIWDCEYNYIQKIA